MRLPTPSLRLRLTFWYTLLFTVIQVGVLSGVVLLRQDVIRMRLQETNRRYAETIAARLSEIDPPWTTADLFAATSPASGFLLLIIRDRDGDAISKWNARRDETQEGLVPFPAWALESHGPETSVHSELTDAAAYRVMGLRRPLRLVTVPFLHRNQQEYFLQAAATPTLNNYLGPVAEVFLLFVPIGIAAAALISWLIAGRAVAPLLRASEAAHDVAPDSLRDGMDIGADAPEVSRLQQELNQALKRLEAGYEAQARFISNVSHEIKTPVSVILAETQVIRSSARDDQALDRYLSSVEEEMSALGRLVESFLVLARAAVGKSLLQRSPVPVNDIIIDSVRACAPLADQHEVRLVPNFVMPEDCDLDPELEGDSELLRTMLDNLIRNAIRFSPPGAAIDVDAHCTETDVTISVRDRGPGVSEEAKDALFEPFVQSGPDFRRRSGHGLGLAIAKSVAETHGGTIHIENHPEGGAVFTVHFRLTAALTPAQPNGSCDHSGGGGGGGGDGDERSKNASS